MRKSTFLHFCELTVWVAVVGALVVPGWLVYAEWRQPKFEGVVPGISSWLFVALASFGIGIPVALALRRLARRLNGDRVVATLRQ